MEIKLIYSEMLEQFFLLKDKSTCRINGKVYYNSIEDLIQSFKDPKWENVPLWMLEKKYQVLGEFHDFEHFKDSYAEYFV